MSLNNTLFRGKEEADKVSVCVFYASWAPLIARRAPHVLLKYAAAADTYTQERIHQEKNVVQYLLLSCDCDVRGPDFCAISLAFRCAPRDSSGGGSNAKSPAVASHDLRLRMMRRRADEL
jgi:hypothetical protein